MDRSANGRPDAQQTSHRDADATEDQAGQAGQAGAGQAGLLRTLGREVAVLVRDLPGELRRISVHAANHRVEVEWAPAEASAAADLPGASRRTAAAGAEDAPQTAEADLGLWTVRAPLVGTFYAAPEPGAEPFVKPGDRVEPGQPIAIVEAMKMMNHVVADAPGRVVEVLVPDGEPVEFDQPLVLLAPPDQDGAA